jgi:hypothetical protein
MNTSYSKRRHIQEVNNRLEKRFLMEQTKETALSELKKNKLECVANGQYQLNITGKDGTDYLGNYFLMKVDGVEYYLSTYGEAYEKNNVDENNVKKYFCENGLPKIGGESGVNQSEEAKSQFEKYGAGCVTNGKLIDLGDSIFNYRLNVNGVEYDFLPPISKYLWARNVKTQIGVMYKCENNKPVIFSPCDLDSQEFSGKKGDMWEYKKISFDSNNNFYCTRKKGSQTWIYVDEVVAKYKKAYEAIDKLYASQENNTQKSDNTTDNQDKSNTRTDDNY